MNKRHELQALVQLLNPHIIGICEVKPKNSRYKVSPNELKLENFDIFHNLDQEGRGIVLYTHHSLKAESYSLGTDFKEYVSAQINLKNKDSLLITVVYRSPSSSAANNDHLNTLLNEIGNNGATHKLTMGDFNYGAIDWENNICEAPTDSAPYTFHQTVLDNYLFQHQREATRVRPGQTPSVLDYILTNEEGMVSDVSTRAGLGKSDHSVLNFTFNCTAQLECSTVRRFKYYAGDYEKLKSFMGETTWMEGMENANVNQAWEMFRDRLNQGMEKFIPRTSSNKNPKMRQRKIWMDGNTLDKVKRKNRLYRKWLETRLDEDLQIYRKANNQARQACRRATYNFEKDVATKAKGNPKHFWKYVQSKLKTKIGVATLTRVDGTKTTSDEEKAQELNDFFSSVFTREPSNHLPQMEDIEGIAKLEGINVTPESICNIIKKLKINKTPGPDGLHPRVFVELADVICTPLHKIFVKSMEESELPQDWKIAYVSPIHKKGARDQANNYRPVSLTSISCKIMETIVRNHIMYHLEQEKLLHSSQHGFIKGKSCITNLLMSLDDWIQALDEGKDIDVIYMDFMKAFDSVPHKRLLVKLSRYGITSKLLKWCESFLLNRRQCVVVNGQKSQWADVHSGIPQGSVLGPLMFIVYINDLPDVVNTAIKLFADDTKIYTTTDRSEELQQDLDNLQNWSNIWLLKFHPEKCGVMHLGRTNDRKDYTMESQLGTISVKKSESEKDLGIHVDSALNFRYHIAQATAKANRIAGLIRRSFECLDLETFNKLFTSMVRPHLEYGNSIWCPYKIRDIEAIEAVQRRATRQLPGMKDLSYEERLRKLKLPTLVYRRARGDIIEVFKHVTGTYKLESPFFQLNTDSITRGHNYKLKKERARLDLRKYFFPHRVVNLWNQLPQDVVNAPTLNSLKNRLDYLWRNADFKYDYKADPYSPPPPGTRQNTRSEAFRPVDRH